jgi:hypothetical protein
MSEPVDGPDAPWHGTAGGYTNHKCRCGPCTTAHSADCARYAQNRAALPTTEIPHGTENGYGNYRCRCELCREAHRVDGRRRRELRKQRVAAQQTKGKKRVRSE